jgi:KaiC/GvpD/RAD55 family RecA-like ATPase
MTVQPIKLEASTARAKAGSADADPQRRGLSLADVIARWRAEGPLEHVATGFPRLDELTGGGPVLGSRWYLMGAPDAGKTAVLVQWLHELARRPGFVAGLLAVDEEPGDVATRIVQREGWRRFDCERREPLMLTEIAERLAGLPLRLYGGDWTIEEAAADLAIFARERGARAALGVDSLQTVTSAAEDPKTSLRELVTARTKAIRAVAEQHRIWVCATSEMARGAYRSVEAAEQTDDMAAAKESGAVEYSARVLLALRSVKGEPDLVELRIAKNKHGPSRERVFLRIDRSRQILGETEAPAEPDLEAEQAEAAMDKTRAAAAAVVQVLARNPGIGTRLLEAKLAAAGHKLGKKSVAAALELAIEKGAVEDRPITRGKVIDHHYFAVPTGASEEGGDDA